MMNHFKRYLVFWLSQAFSQLGSSMTGFALILWAYEQNGTAMTVSLMSFFNYMPYILVSLFAGTFVDRHNEKKIMLTADTAAAVCSLIILVLAVRNVLAMWGIYLINFLLGFMNAFQGPASSVVIGKVVPKDKLEQVSGMNSFSGNLTAVLSPVFASALFAWRGLYLILAIDLLSFLFAFLVLAFILKIPEELQKETEHTSILDGSREGFRYLKQNRGLLKVMLTMALLNFFSRLTYENILSPMILSRSGNDSVALGIVNAAIGIGGVAGGILVSAGIIKTDRAKLIYVSAMISFLLGDIPMGLGRNVIIWSAAGLAASFPIPFINAGQMLVLFHHVPEEMQGRLFALRNAIQFSSIPLGILLGGVLADYVFEPFMSGNHVLVSFLKLIVGEGAGSGMAVMFLCTGILGTAYSLIFYRQKDIRDL